MEGIFAKRVWVMSVSRGQSQRRRTVLKQMGILPVLNPTQGRRSLPPCSHMAATNTDPYPRFPVHVAGTARRMCSTVDHNVEARASALSKWTKVPAHL